MVAHTAIQSDSKWYANQAYKNLIYKQYIIIHFATHVQAHHFTLHLGSKDSLSAYINNLEAQW